MAGKRVAPQWIRRTLTCERVEDCQFECAREKRFPCEGFNYRLDPSGRGQGICELVDVPLSGMDIYSSPNRRDESLLYHPDYDYYERDRNACRPSPCKDCRESEPNVNKQYLPAKPTSGGYEQHPTTYRPFEHYKPPSASDRFRPPMTSSIDRYGPPPPNDYQSYGPPPRPYHDYDRPPPPRPVYGPPPPSSSYELDRFDAGKPVDRPHYSEVSIYTGTYHTPEDYSSHDRPPPSYETPFSLSYLPAKRPDHFEPSHAYLDRDREQRPPSHYKKPQPPFIPYTINQENDNRYGNSHHQGPDSWTATNNVQRKDQHFNYFNLGGDKPHPEENSVLSYPGSKYHDNKPPSDDHDKSYYGNLWTRRPGADGKLQLIPFVGFLAHFFSFFPQNVR